MRACVCARARVSVCVCACACAMCAVYVYLATCTPHVNVHMLNIKKFDKNGRERVEGDSWTGYMLLYSYSSGLWCAYDRAVTCLWHCQGCVELV